MRSIVYLLFLGLVLSTSAKVYSRCQLIKELSKHAFFLPRLPDWVCLIEVESGRNTSAISHQLTNGSRNFGLFQINGTKWCKRKEPYGLCGVNCLELANEEGIEVARECVAKIYKISGFNAWNAWKDKCKGKLLPIVRSRCFS